MSPNRRGFLRGLNKYHNIKTKVDGIVFHSKAEASRYLELKLLESNNLIQELQLQPRFPMVVGGKKICDYIADFQYLEESPEGAVSMIIEDVKGVETEVFKIKKKLFEALYPQFRLTLISASSRR